MACAAPSSLADLVAGGDPPAGEGEKKAPTTTSSAIVRSSITTQQLLSKQRSSSTSTVETAHTTSAEYDVDDDDEDDEREETTKSTFGSIENDSVKPAQQPVHNDGDSSPETSDSNTEDSVSTTKNNNNTSQQQSGAAGKDDEEELAASLLQTLTFLPDEGPPPLPPAPSVGRVPSQSSLKSAEKGEDKDPSLSPSSEQPANKKAVRFQQHAAGGGGTEGDGDDDSNHHAVVVVYPEKLSQEQATSLAATASAAATTPPPTPTDPQAPVQKKKLQRRVSFGHMSVHEFPCALGDHPAVSDGGPPIRLEYSGGSFCSDGGLEASASGKTNGSSNNNSSTHSGGAAGAAAPPPPRANPVYSFTLPVEEYEFCRPARRTLLELRVPAAARRQWLLQSDADVTAHDLDGAERQVRRAQRQRHASLLLQEVEEWQLAHESCRRKVRRWWRNRTQRRRNGRGGNRAGGDGNNSDNEDGAVDAERVAEEWYRQYKQQKLAERRERIRLRRSQTA